MSSPQPLPEPQDPRGCVVNDFGLLFSPGLRTAIWGLLGESSRVDATVAKTITWVVFEVFPHNTSYGFFSRWRINDFVLCEDLRSFWGWKRFPHIYEVSGFFVGSGSSNSAFCLGALASWSQRLWHLILSSIPPPTSSCYWLCLPIWFCIWGCLGRCKGIRPQDWLIYTRPSTQICDCEKSPSQSI